MRKLAALSLSLFLMAPAVAFAGKGHQCTDAIDVCLNRMVKKLKSTGFIGVELDEKSPEVLVVTKVVAGSPAEAAGIQANDELYSLNGIRFGKDNYKKMGKVKKPGNNVHVTIKRNGHAKKMKITLAAMPADLMAKYIGEYVMARAEAEQAAKIAKK